MIIYFGISNIILLPAKLMKAFVFSLLTIHY